MTTRHNATPARVMELCACSPMTQPELDTSPAAGATGGATKPAGTGALSAASPRSTGSTSRSGWRHAEYHPMQQRHPHAAEPAPNTLARSLPYFEAATCTACRVLILRTVG